MGKKRDRSIPSCSLSHATLTSPEGSGHRKDLPMGESDHNSPCRDAAVLSINDLYIATLKALICITNNCQEACDRMIEGGRL